MEHPGEQRRHWHIPLVTIRRDGSLALSPAAFELLRPAEFVVLAYEPATHILTIMPTSADTRRSLSLVRDGTSGLIRARRFWRRSGIAEAEFYGRHLLVEAERVEGEDAGDVTRLMVHLMLSTTQT